MNNQSKMIDISSDPLNDIKIMDKNQSDKAKERRARTTASTMKSVGFSDQEIMDKFGYIPKPFEK